MSKGSGGPQLRQRPGITQDILSSSHRVGNLEANVLSLGTMVRLLGWDVGGHSGSNAWSVWTKGTSGGQWETCSLFMGALGEEGTGSLKYFGNS